MHVYLSRIRTCIAPNPHAVKPPPKKENQGALRVSAGVFLDPSKQDSFTQFNSKQFVVPMIVFGRPYLDQAMVQLVASIGAPNQSCYSML